MNERISLMFPTAYVTDVSILQYSAVLLQQEMPSTQVPGTYPYLHVPVLLPSRKDMRKRGVIPIGTHRIARLVPLWKSGLTPVSQAVKTALTYRATA